MSTQFKYRVLTRPNLVEYLYIRQWLNWNMIDISEIIEDGMSELLLCLSWTLSNSFRL